MVIFDDDGNMLDTADPERGWLEERSKRCYHEWVVDVPAVTEDVIVAEYKNGGKDVDRRIVTPEEGHWVTYDVDGENLPYEGEYPDWWVEQGVVESVFQYAVFHEFTEEQLAEREEQMRIFEESQRKKAEREAMIESLPEYQASMDDAICELYEMMIGGTL